MPFSIVQVQGGQLALADAEGNVLGVIDDDGIKRLAVQALITADPESPKLLDNAMALAGILKELQRIRVLLEHLTDERVHEHDIETRD
jgi:hypothetical protein